MSDSHPRRAAGPAPRRAPGARFALGVVGALAAILGLGMLAVGLFVLIPLGMGVIGLFVALGGGVLTAIGLIGVLIGVVVAVRGASHDAEGDTEMGSMVGNFVEDDDEEDTGIA